jgi:hypothetical protein
MYTPGTVIYFTPFYFSDGTSKNKYFLVLAAGENDLLVASLPTSKDHIPLSIEKRHGCINEEKIKVNCYFYKAGTVISECGTFSFPRDTYVYGEQLAAFNKAIMQTCYKEEGTDYVVSCKLSDIEFRSIKECLKQAGNVKKKFKKYL